ncbi:MAG: tRNA dihydrouridine synthase DusB [Deltaproteobacteria bacterium]|nr:tRNA dihydrouridine synthase DusB [Deltaproteobacteria bacterium]
MFQIGELKLENRLILAPMAGITNLPFRRIAKKMGVSLVTSEMVSAVGLARGSGKTFNYLRSVSEERPLAVQIFGADPGIMAEAASIVVSAGADVVDINMGCPARKVVRTGGGGSLLKVPHGVAEMVRAVREACPVPLTVKMRSGWSVNHPQAYDIAPLIEEAGADAITVHPRYVTQGFSGTADWNVISRVKTLVRIPVIGNGDITTPQMALQMREETQCDAVMVGRGAVGNPWLLKQILELQEGRPLSQPGIAERQAVILEHFHLLKTMIGEQRASKAMRGLLLKYTKGLPHSSRFRGAFTGVKDLRSIMDAMDDYFAALEDSACRRIATQPAHSPMGTTAS